MKVLEGKIIDYKDSPDGKGYIGFCKEPLMKVKKGYGFLGCKIQNIKRDKIQCHICGQWYSRLNLHVMYSHCTLDEYRKKFGFTKTAALVSDEESKKQAIQCLQMIQEGILAKNGFQKGHKPSGNSLPNLKNRQQDTMQFKNQWGTCDEQVKDRVLNHIKRFKALPNKRAGNDGINYVGEHLRVLLQRKYGSSQKAYKLWGLPYVASRQGSVITYKFPDNSTLTVRARNADDRAKLYNVMLKKCEILK